MKYLRFIIAFLFLVSEADACRVPDRAPKYDALINVTRIDARKFLISAPKRAFDLDFGLEISLAYFENGTAPYLPEFIRPIEVMDAGTIVKAELEVPIKSGFTPFVMAYWQPEYCCICGAIGSYVLELK